jgi:two-component system sensor histidine kinase KdpD
MAEAARAETLRETERLKSLLLSSFSHNLKTPLSSLAATISSLRQGDIEWEPDASRELLSQMEEDIERLTEHIGNLIELAHLESGTRKPQQEGLELREIVSMAVRRLPQRSYERLTIALPEDLPLVWVDGVQLSQVVRHVLENAVDYSTPDSAVTLEAAPAAESVRFWVDDAGPGIAEEEKDKIFQRFYRGKAASEKAIRGTGLGLAICREILQANEGSITVEPSPRGGARFVITVPSRASSEQR